MYYPILLSLIAGAAAVPAGNPEPTIRVTLNNEGQYLPGDRSKVQVITRDDGYLLVFQLDPDGHLRVLFPLDPTDDNYVRGGKRYLLLGRGGREGFTVDAPGSGVVFAAVSLDPWRFNGYVQNDHWDYRALNTVVYDDPEPNWWTWPRRWPAAGSTTTSWATRSRHRRRLPTTVAGRQCRCHRRLPRLWRRHGRECVGPLRSMGLECRLGLECWLGSRLGSGLGSGLGLGSGWGWNVGWGWNAGWGWGPGWGPGWGWNNGCCWNGGGVRRWRFRSRPISRRRGTGSGMDRRCHTGRAERWASPRRIRWRVSCPASA